MLCMRTEDRKMNATFIDMRSGANHRAFNRVSCISAPVCTEREPCVCNSLAQRINN